ncbi:MAG: helix-turn-helix domain-containing protein [Anaerolineales bacterium]|nr:helix-turn-helix domain-containing protein [Anaerolineales bacterium]
MSPARYLSAQEAAHELGISLPTLYAYVSRGLIHSEATGGSKRTRRYWAEDVQKLKERQEQRRDPAKVVETALHWGAPVLESAITLLANDHLYYRGYDALELATQRSVEQVAALIWTGELAPAGSALFGQATGALPPEGQSVRPHLAGLSPVETFQAILPLAAVDDLAAYDLRPAAVAQTGARILRLLTTLAAGDPPAGLGIAQTLQQGWTPHNAQAAALLNAALILCADHELNVSSFTARCVASAGSTPYQLVLAGLAALQGIKHGRMTERVELFWREASTPEGVRSTLANYLKRGETIPGFGHPLYPQGDPRGRLLLELTTAAYPELPAVKLAQAMVAETFELIGEYPTIDFGLVTLAQALTLPAGGAITLFALGRTIGWIGHAIEQYQLDRIIRPRAQYKGRQPGGM